MQSQIKLRRKKPSQETWGVCLVSFWHQNTEVRRNFVVSEQTSDPSTFILKPLWNLIDLNGERSVCWTYLWKKMCQCGQIQRARQEKSVYSNHSQCPLFPAQFSFPVVLKLFKTLRTHPPQSNSLSRRPPFFSWNPKQLFVCCCLFCCCFLFVFDMAFCVKRCFWNWRYGGTLSTEGNYRAVF